MVYAVMIHSIDHTTAVWLSMFYTAEGLDGFRKIRERTLASEIRRKFIDLNHAPRGPERQRADWVVSSLESTAISKMSTERAADTVMFKLPPSQLIQEPTTVVSRIVHNCAFTLVLAPHENRSQSLLVLDLLVSILNEHFKNSVIATQPQEFLSRVDEVLFLLDRFLPDGRLQFISKALAKQIRLQADVMFASK